MLKKIIKRAEKELDQACDYLEQAFKVKHDCLTLGDLFSELAKEEINHAERLIKEGHSLAMGKLAHDEFLPVWKWMVNKYTDRINDLTVKMNRYRTFWMSDTDPKEYFGIKRIIF